MTAREQNEEAVAAASTLSAVPGGSPRRDALLECLVYLTAHFGRARSADAIRAGLPYDEKGMSPALFREAADRIGLRAKIVKKPSVADIDAALYPVVLMLADGTALIAKGRGEDGTEVYAPDTATHETLPDEALAGRYAGYAIYVRPRAEFLEPGASDPADFSRHWFWGSVAENKSVYLSVLGAAVLINLFGLVSPLFVMNVYDRVIPNNAVETGWVLGIGALTVFVFDFIMRTLRGYFIDFASRKSDVVSSRRIYDHLLNMRLAERPASSGSFANMLREFESVRDFMTSATITGFVDLPFTCFYLLVIFLIGGPVAILLFVLIAAVLVAGILLQMPLKSRIGRSNHAAQAKHGLLVETIYGLETIKASGGEGRMRARYETQVGESAAAGQESRFYSGLAVNIATFFQQTGSIIIILMGMYLVRDAQLTTGGLIACVLLGNKAISPIGQAANLLTRYHHARQSLAALDAFMRQPVERKEGHAYLNRPSLDGRLAFENVSFSYPRVDRNVLSHVSFRIEAGEKVGIIGRIGSGKSTVARLVLGLYEPVSGAVYADGTDYRQIDPADLRRHIAYIAQDITLFRGSVRDNIAFGAPFVTDDDILRAAKTSGVHEFISRHPMGYDAPVGERGEGLSGGQRQAVALARALILQPRILVCDEPTNAMDSQGEEAFARLIKNETKGKTLILITHRPHLLTLVDRLIVLDQGKLIVDGPRDKVLEALAAGRIKVDAQ